MIVSNEHSVSIIGASLRSRTYIFGYNQQVCSAVYSAAPESRRYLRVQYGCMLGTVFGSLDCDCAQQIALSISVVVERGGIVLYFRDHEAYGLGVFEKAQMLHDEQSCHAAHIASLQRAHSYRNRHSVLYFVPEIISTIPHPEALICLGGSMEKAKLLRKLGVPIERSERLEISLEAISDFGRQEVEWRSRRLSSGIRFAELKS